jgi:excinuclease ABC subunit C
MKGEGGRILYVGKAKNLKNRIKNYFTAGGDGRWIIPYLQDLVEEIDTVVTGTEKEALLLECTLIKKHRPRFNALLKDDKTYTALKLNTSHPWPMLSLIRYKGKLKKDAEYFGPYTSAYDARVTLDLLQKVFPLRQCSDQEFLRRTRPCILYGMKRCSAPCVNLVSKGTYDGYVDGVRQFLKGKSSEVIDVLQKQMQVAADLLEFERAGEILSSIRSIEKTLQMQSVEKPTHGISGDVLAIFRQGDEVVLSQLIFQSGQLNAYHHHSFSKTLETDEELLESFCLQHYLGAPCVPKEVFIPIELENKEAIEEIIWPPLTITVPVRGEKRGLIEMAKANAEAAFKQKKDERSLRENTLLDLQEKLRLSRYPERMECLDTSHLSGAEAVSSLVAFTDGIPDKSRYRRYKLRTIKEGDDYGAMREVLLRRYSKEDFPDLLIVDGGKGHLNIALKVLKELNIVSMDVIGVAKEEGRHDRGATSEQVFLPNVKDPLFLSPHSPLLFLLQRIRDEAHRFAITYQKKRRTKTTIRSALAEIPGIGPARQKALLRHFGSMKRIQEASREELLEVKGMTSATVEAILKNNYVSAK